MSNKPSLYVVERKEVVVLVILFVLVTVLSFTLGVKYGQSVGKTLAQKEASAKQEIADEHQTESGGTLNEGEASHHAKAESEGEHSDESAAADSHHADAKHGNSEKAEAPAPMKPAEKAALMDTGSDQVLLDALKEAAIEGQSAKVSTRLPEKTKTINSRPVFKPGSFVIQVGSYPSRKDAEQQLSRLQGRKVQAQILPASKDKHGEWHRVVLGSYSNRNDAEKEAKLYKEKGIIKTYFVRKMN